MVSLGQRLLVFLPTPAGELLLLLPRDAENTDDLVQEVVQSVMRVSVAWVTTCIVYARSGIHQHIISPGCALVRPNTFLQHVLHHCLHQVVRVLTDGRVQAVVHSMLRRECCVVHWVHSSRNAHALCCGGAVDIAVRPAEVQHGNWWGCVRVLWCTGAQPCVCTKACCRVLWRGV